MIYICTQTKGDLPIQYLKFAIVLHSPIYEYRQEGSQETVATMIGMALGMLLAHLTMGHSIAIWFSFLSLTVFHMYGQYDFDCNHMF